jgi:predicted ATPase
MGRILAQIASAGIQIIVESHSDHLLNGIRLAVKERLIPHNQVAIHFFGGPKPDGHGVISPGIDPEGTISDWPSGFFDQTERDLARLSGWA